MSLSREALNPSQAELLDALLQEPRPRRIVWTGAIRSGKGVGTAYALIRMAIRRWRQGLGNGHYLLAGTTSGTFERNNEDYLVNAAEARGLSLVRVAGKQPGYKLFAGKAPVARFYTVGGDNRRSYQKVRGMTLDAAWIDEATLCDPSFITTVEQRLTFPGSCIILTHNADKPAHWLKTEWVDKADANTKLLWTDYEENRYLDEDVRAYFRSGNPNQASYQRGIGNLWAAAEGLVFDIPEAALIDYMCGRQGEAFIDPGVGSICAGLLAVPQGKGVVAVAAEYYHDAEQAGRLTDEEHLSRIIRKWNVTRLTIDPESANMRAVASRKDEPPFRRRTTLSWASRRSTTPCGKASC